MIVPSTRLFTAGEVETGAFLNSAVTNLGNFMLGKPIAQLRQTSAQTLTTISTTYDILFDTEDIDRDNGHSTVTNTGRYTAQTAGWYYVSGAVGFSANAIGTRVVNIAVNGSALPVGLNRPNYATSASLILTVPTTPVLTYLNVGDYVTLQATAGVASLQTTVTSGYQSFLSLVWVSL